MFKIFSSVHGQSPAGTGTFDTSLLARAQARGSQKDLVAIIRAWLPLIYANAFLNAAALFVGYSCFHNKVSTEVMSCSTHTHHLQDTIFSKLPGYRDVAPRQDTLSHLSANKSANCQTSVRWGGLRGLGREKTHYKLKLL